MGQAPSARRFNLTSSLPTAYRAADGKRSVFADVRDAFGSELNAGQQSALISWLAFTGTFGCVRGITHAIRAGKGEEAKIRPADG
jgi:hypothetical protein